MPIETLMEFGLSEKEAQIYLALLELEVAGASEIAKKSGVNRSSVYVVIESLKKQGLVSESADKTTQKFVAASPELLLQKAKDTTKKQIEIKEKIATLVPELKALHKETKHKPKVMVYEGKEALKQAYFEPSPAYFSGDLRVYENPADLIKYLPGFIEMDAMERKKRGVKMYAISPDTLGNRELKKRYKATKSPSEVILIPKKKFEFPRSPIDFAVYGDEISFASLKDSFCIIIKNQEIADTLKNIFDLALEEAGRLSKKGR